MGILAPVDGANYLYLIIAMITLHPLWNLGHLIITRNWVNSKLLVTKVVPTNFEVSKFIHFCRSMNSKRPAKLNFVEK